jgi:hypothetical protein
MTEMKNGETVIKVMDHKVGEMIRKGWQVKESGYSEPEFVEELVIQDDSEEE